jgi:hypothetical protein
LSPPSPPPPPPPPPPNACASARLRSDHNAIAPCT